jgi:hypothetical protein
MYKVADVYTSLCARQPALLDRRVDAAERHTCELRP